MLKLKMTQNCIKNIIFTGVAGTGKTFELQRIAKENYTEILPTASPDALLKNLVEPLSWREVICLVFLQEKQNGKGLLKVAEILANPIFVTKANLKSRSENLTQTIWSTLQQFTNPNSQTVNYSNRASQAFFDKDESSNWFLLPDSLSLLSELQAKLTDYQTSISTNFQPSFSQPKLERFSFVSFHQAYGYEEFVEGIRPVPVNRQLNYTVKAGAFLQLCQQAQADPNHRYAMLIDEINRANVSRVFGELMSLIEPSKRAGQPEQMRVHLAYSGQPFGVPSNVDIYASMNTQDHSLAPLDMAFRRRFEFIEVLPNPHLLGKVANAQGEVDLAKLLTALNQKIALHLGKEGVLGHSFLMGIDSVEALASRFGQSIIPQVAQACMHHGEVLQAIFGSAIIELVSASPRGFGQAKGFVVNDRPLNMVACYQEMYQCVP